VPTQGLGLIYVLCDRRTFLGGIKSCSIKLTVRSGKVSCWGVAIKG
jgi:hypothetical protein